MTATPERYAADPRVLELFSSALALPAGERSAYLAARRDRDPGLVEAVADLVASHDAAPEFLADTAPTTMVSCGLKRVGPYAILDTIGSGASGVVYRAEQANPRREVAVKVLACHGLLGDARRRFRREAELLGRLQHPYLAQVFDAGVQDTEAGEIAYFAMELVRGVPIDVAARDLDLHHVCELLAKVAEAVQHAHEHGIVHRDLKPANILVVGREPGQLQPKLLDFGIARSLDRTDDQLVHTMTGMVIGTLPYMSPEQVRGGTVGTATDIYALGAIAYELLTGRVPHAVADLPVATAMRRICEDEPTRLRHLRHDLPRDLETVIGVALAKDEQQRYASAAAFAGDLRRVLHDEPIVARPPSARYRLRKFVRRNRTLVASTLTAFALLLAGTIAVSALAVHNAALAASEHSARLESEGRRAALTRRNYSLEMLSALSTIHSPTGVRLLTDTLDRWRPRDGQPDLRGFEWDLLAALDREPKVQLPTPHQVYACRFHPREPWVLIGGNGFAHILEVPSGRRLGELPWGGHMYSVRWSPDGRAIAAVQGDRVLLADGAPPFAPHRELVIAGAELKTLAWHADGEHLAVFDFHHSAWSVNTRTGEIGAAVPELGGPDETEFQPAGQLLATASGLVRGPQLAKLPALDAHDRVRAARWSSDGKLLAAVTRNDIILVAADGRVRARRPQSMPVAALAWHRAGNQLALLDGDGGVEIRDVATWMRLHSARYADAAFGADGLSVDWSPDGRWLACGRRAKDLAVLDLSGHRAVRVLMGGLGRLQCWGRVQWHPEQRSLAVSLRGTTRRLDADTGGASDELQGWTRVISPDGAKEAWVADREIVVRGADGQLRRAVTEPIPPGSGALLAWNAASDALLIGGPTHLWLWRLDEPARRIAEQLPVSGLAFAPDGAHAYATSAGRLLRIATASGQIVAERETPQPALTMALSADARYVAVSTERRRVLVYSTEQLELTRELDGLESDSVSLSWQPGGRRLAAAARGGVCLWDPTTGELTARLTELPAAADCAFSPDGTELAVLDAMGCVIVFDTRGVRR